MHVFNLVAAAGIHLSIIIVPFISHYCESLAFFLRQATLLFLLRCAIALSFLQAQ